MAKQDAVANDISTPGSPCYFLHFGLIVTGEGEREHLPKIFKSLAATKVCNFEVIRFVGQRGPITSPKRKLKMVGEGKIIPDKDTQEIGLPARKYLSADKCRFVILMDDVEHDRRDQIQQLFDRYKQAFNTILRSSDQQHRASVHFLANMLEAYYFADANAINIALALDPPLEDFDGDVEDIPHPKGELKKIYPGFREVHDGGQILDLIDIEHVLSKPNTCASLRTLFAWCAKVIEQYSAYEDLSLTHKYQLQDGILNEVTRLQLDDI